MLKYRKILENVINSLRDGFYIVDANGTHLEVNPAFCEMTGFSREELLGDSPPHPYWPDEASEDTSHKLQEILNGKSSDIELVFKRKSGKNFPVIVRPGTLRDENGEVLGYLATVKDITERKQAEEKLSIREERFRSLVQHGAEGIYLLQFDQLIPINLPENEQIKAIYKGRIVACNDTFAHMYGYSRWEEMVGKRLIEIHGSEDNPKNIELLRSWIRANYRIFGTVSKEFGKDNNQLYISNNLIGIIEGDCIVGVWGSQQDITERRKAEEKSARPEANLQQVQKLESLGMLASGIAHDFNNLLVGILGNAGLALMEISKESPAYECVQDIETAALRATELTNQMLAYSGKGKFIVEPLNLSSNVEEMFQLLESAVSKKVDLQLNLAKDLHSIAADASQIRQVIMNLVTNASDAIGDRRGTITVTTGGLNVHRTYLSETYLDDDLPEGYYAYIEVTDTGSGMDSDTREKIFDPFFTTKFTGRGLGLAAVFGIVRGHNGAIKVSSELGKGSTIRVLFPCEKQQAKISREQIELAVHTEGWRGRGKILVVDDEELVRDVARRTLKRAGFSVLMANDGREAVEVFRNHADEIIAVLLDLTMPELGGEEAFIEMRKISPDVGIILSSGFTEQEAASKFAGAGIAYFIQKPYQPEILLEKIQKLLSEKARYPFS
jgi:PAS domain S-box-containing protein